MIAIPDFAAGAMENWGLITYRETAMLFKPGESSESNKKRVAAVVSHELAHQVCSGRAASYNKTSFIRTQIIKCVIVSHNVVTFRLLTAGLHQAMRSMD